jgi:DNA segregation ATPase FtsK/SpoIIIE-like protein
MTLRKRTLALLIAAALTPQFAATAYAQAPGYAPPPAQVAPTRAYTQAELDQMLAPIALYPDALLSQVLMAATYPIEVVEAARWTRANPGLRGDAAVRAVQYQDWDPSVKSLCAFPQILQRMDEHLQWTENLGDAFLAQEAAVMDSVQELRQRAYASGHLRSTDQIRVVHEGPYYYVRPVRPEIVYVPYYDPLVVYGDWRWPAYRPYAWAPWPGYVRPAPGVSIGFWFGTPVSLSANFFFGDFDWGRRSVRVVRPTAYYYRQPTVVVQNTYINRDRSTWQHDPHHRRGAEYRQTEVRQRFASAQTERRTEQRATFRGEQREAQRPEQRQAQQPRFQQQAQPQARPEQTRPERREAREEQRQRSEARPAERAQQQQREQAQAAERAQRQQQDQQREQARAAERAQQQQQRQQAEARAQQQQAQQQQRQQAEAARAQQRQQAEAARAQQRQAQQQQRQQAEAARAQQRQQAESARAQQQQQRQQAQAAEQGQRQQRQQAREERKGQREERREQHAGNKGD